MPGEEEIRNKQEENTVTKTNNKVVIRCLPPTLKAEDFLEQISPIADHDYYYYVQSRVKFGVSAYSRAYINFTHQSDLFMFKDKFDGYVFVDAKGNEYPAIVEFAPFQKIPKKKAKKADARQGTIENDSDYKRFLDSILNPDPEESITPSIMLAELEQKEQQAKEKKKMDTPLIEHMRKKREERRATILKIREEGRQRDLERRRQRDEDIRMRREERYRGHREMELFGVPTPNFKVLKRGESDDSSEERPASKSYVTASYLREKQAAEREKERERIPAYARREERIRKDKNEKEERDPNKKEKEKRKDKDRERRRDRSRDRQRDNSKERDRERREKKKESRRKERSKDTSKDETTEDRARRVRNKNRPEIALYVPGRRNTDRSKTDSRESTHSRSVSRQSSLQEKSASGSCEDVSRSSSRQNDSRPTSPGDDVYKEKQDLLETNLPEVEQSANIDDRSDSEPHDDDQSDREVPQDLDDVENVSLDQKDREALEAEDYDSHESSESDELVDSTLSLEPDDSYLNTTVTNKKEERVPDEFCTLHSPDNENNYAENTDDENEPPHQNLDDQNAGADDRLDGVSSDDDGNANQHCQHTKLEDEHDLDSVHKVHDSTSSSDGQLTPTESIPERDSKSLSVEDSPDSQIQPDNRNSPAKSEGEDQPSGDETGTSTVEVGGGYSDEGNEEIKDDESCRLNHEKSDGQSSGQSDGQSDGEENVRTEDVETMEKDAEKDDDKDNSETVGKDIQSEC